MKVLLIADGRSPITLRWIAMLQPLQYEIVLLSSYPCEPIQGVQRIHTLPLAFAGGGGSQAGSGGQGVINRVVSRIRPLAQKMRHALGPWNVTSKAPVYRSILHAERPDLVHALRIPFEGMLAAFTPLQFPVLVSTWGNDLTLHAPATRKMAAMTRHALSRADGLLTDIRRDVDLAREWGFAPHKVALTVPGNGGLDLQEMAQVVKGIHQTDPPVVFNPRGLRSYVRTDTFFTAVPLVLARHPNVRFRCASMAGQPAALAFLQQPALQNHVTLLPTLTQPELWQELASARVSLSLSEHDGTPNTLLEAMALGCLPVCGDIESIREWITPADNGLLVDPHDPAAAAETICRALEDDPLCARAAKTNRSVVRNRADIKIVRQQVKEFYEQHT